MKVLQVVEATTAGVGRHVGDLSVQLLRDGVEVLVACPSVRQGAQADRAFVARLGEAGVQVVLVPMVRSIRPWADLRACRQLMSVLDRERVDVVHVHSSKAGVLGRLAVRGGERPHRWEKRPAVVYTPHAFAFLGARGKLQRWVYRAVERWLGWRATDALICVSQSELALANRESVASPERLVTIKNGLDTTRFTQAGAGPAGWAKARLGLDPERPVVGFVGRLSRQKGVETLVGAARLVDEQVKGAQFVLVGEGELEGTLREMSHPNSEVLLLGYRDDIPTVMAALDLFVLPSLYEGLPYTLMEAMATGLPVVVSDVAGNRDLVRHGEDGLLVPPGEVGALADALISLLRSPEKREQLGRKAREAARSFPTLTEMSAQVQALYSRLLSDEETNH